MEQNISITPQQKQLVLGYKGEAFENLSAADEAMTCFKELVAAASETTKLPKGIISKYFKTAYKDEVKKVTEEAEIISFLNE